MMRATKCILILCVVLNLVGHPIESKIIGWDYCIEEGHPFWLYIFKFGWPIPGVIVNQIWGCLSTPNQWVEFSWPGLIGTTVFWITVFWILESYWPNRPWECEDFPDNCDGQNPECKRKDCSWCAYLTIRDT